MMTKCFAFTLLLIASAAAQLTANCCQNVDVTVGWRRDSLEWKNQDIHPSYSSSSSASTRANSKIHFTDIDSYTINGEAKWTACNYYIRLSGDYGLTAKGRAHEKFKIEDSILYYGPIRTHTSDPVKRRSEVYDFNAALGYPLTFCCSRFYVVPLIGFSYHRQHLRVKQKEHYSSSSSDYSCICPCTSSSCSLYCPSYGSSSLFSSSSRSKSSHLSSSDFSVDSSSNPFGYFVSGNPFSSSSSSDERIASALGLYNHHRTDNYRFTWYGFYLGVDGAYAMDCDWTLYTELEAHFLDNCHQKRKSWSGVDCVDNFHHKGWACGFNGVIGLVYSLRTCWYVTASVDFKWWKSDNSHNDLSWKTVGANIGLGYVF
jgi:hypothetical protein